MKLEYKSKTLEKECSDFAKATRSYGDNCAKLLHRRIRELKSSDSLEDMVKYRVGRCHPLKGNLVGKFALDLEHPYRLIVEPIKDSSNTYGIRIVRLLEVDDYHGN